GRPGRRFRLMTTPAHSSYRDPDAWTAAAPVHEGSWWPAWSDWLTERSGEPVPPPPLGTPEHPPLTDAPGSYILAP
ncbi:MAG TPA: poly-beta-hydroxybutyrate polymerase, partial [Amaricoccus sp.]|nr:poly-beta-hydroxybutyrate polymerase [Amaricoccus sp.]